MVTITIHDTIHSKKSPTFEKVLEDSNLYTFDIFLQIMEFLGSVKLNGFFHNFYSHTVSDLCLR